MLHIPRVPFWARYQELGPSSVGRGQPVWFLEIVFEELCFDGADDCDGYECASTVDHGHHKMTWISNRILDCVRRILMNPPLRIPQPNDFILRDQ